MSDKRTKARLAVSEFQSASRTKFEAERDFTRAHDQLGKLLDDLIAESEGLRWPEPRPIEEAPQEAVLGWCPRQEEWITCYPWHKDYWNGIDGERHEITHFLPLPPKPEVRK